MTDPAIVASLIAVVGAVIIALGGVFFRFGRLSALMENLRHDQTRRHDEYLRASKERYDGLILRLARLENHFISGAAGDND